MKKYSSVAIAIIFTMLFLTTGSSHSQVTTYVDEAAYLADLASLGYIAVPQEGFEDDLTWGASREPGSAPSITSQGIVWTSNFAANDIKTGTGAARCEGTCIDPDPWGLFSIPHGNPDRVTNPTMCNVIPVPPECLMQDGFIAASSTTGTIFGAGGWVKGTFSANVIFILDGNEASPVDFGDAGRITGVGHQFFGVIDTLGFTTVEVRETEGKSGDEKLIFGDDFTFATQAVIDPVPDMKANGSDGPITISSAQSLVLTGALDSGIKAGTVADWWVLADTPFGWFCFKLYSRWQPGMLVTYQGPLFDLSPYQLMNMTLPAGSYTFYFGVDMIMNGLLDMGQIYYDSVQVTVTP